MQMLAFLALLKVESDVVVDERSEIFVRSLNCRGWYDEGP